MRLMEASRTATNDKPTIIPIKMTDCSESKIKNSKYISTGRVTDALIILKVFYLLTDENIIQTPLLHNRMLSI